MVAVPFELPRVQEAADANTTCIRTENWLYHQRFADRQELYGPDALARVTQGKTFTAYQYLAARQSKFEITRLWSGLFEKFDVMAIPAVTVKVPRFDQEDYVIDGKNYAPRSVTGIFTPPFNLTGLPALVVPIGDVDGLPVGMQLVGPHFSEARLLAIGYALEQALGNPTAKWGIEPQR